MEASGGWKGMGSSAVDWSIASKSNLRLDYVRPGGMDEAADCSLDEDKTEGLAGLMA
jgi:hypothetical protein